MVVQLLPDNLVNKIAAGEVVDRPAAVVKELVENAIDAGATRITVSIEGGGRSLIEVHDNGCGLGKADALMAFERHATSKLASEDDLFSLQSRGFRGEALPSIASISKISLRTSTGNDELGVHLQIDGGKIISVTPEARAQGTTIQVRSLFYNTPVRRKFLRSEEYESAKIKQILRRIALPEPEISFELIDKGKTVLYLDAPTTFLERSRTLLHGATVVCHTELSGIEVSGVIGHPAQSTSSLESLVIFVNRRPVNDKLIARAIRDGFESTLKAKEFPLGVIAVTVAPSMVDVNVHPQKSEVRFVRPQDVFSVVKQGVHDAFRSFKEPLPHDWSTPVSKSINYLNGREASTEKHVIEEQQTLFKAQSNIFSNFRTLLPDKTPKAPVVNYIESNIALKYNTLQDSIPANPAQHTEPFAYSNLRYLGIVSSCYLLFEARGGALVVMDMHAAHERVNFAKLLHSVNQNKTLTSQPLLVPYLVDLGEEVLSKLLELHPIFESFGFSVRHVSDSALEILSEPILPFVRTHLRRSEVQIFFREIAASDWGADIKDVFRDRIAAILARVACHASIRSGDAVEPVEVMALCTALDEIDNANACPHGRPVVVRFPKSSLEKWFGRDK